jgi:hypothetical protein
MVCTKPLCWAHGRIASIVWAVGISGMEQAESVSKFMRHCRLQVVPVRRWDSRSGVPKLSVINGNFHPCNIAARDYLSSNSQRRS